MTRVLKRPMFRLGGPANEGITSGLAPRQGYQGTNNSADQRVMSPMEKKFLEQRAITEKYAPTRGGGDLSQFLIDFGLDVASATPSGSIFSTAAQSAKAPYERFQDRKTTRAATEADMFSTLFEGAAEAQGEAKAGKGWLEQWKFQQIPLLNNKIAKLQKNIASGTLSEDEMAQAERDLRSSEDQLNRLVELDPMTERWINSDEGDRVVQRRVGAAGYQSSRY